MNIRALNERDRHNHAAEGREHCGVAAFTSAQPRVYRIGEVGSPRELAGRRCEVNPVIERKFELRPIYQGDEQVEVVPPEPKPEPLPPVLFEPPPWKARRARP